MVYELLPYYIHRISFWSCFSAGSELMTSNFLGNTLAIELPRLHSKMHSNPNTYKQCMSTEPDSQYKIRMAFILQLTLTLTRNVN